MEQNLKSQITRNRILEAAEAVFSEKGLSAARVDEIANRAEVNKRMVYAHFENKVNLYKTVLKIVYDRVAEYETRLEQMEFDSCDCVRRVITMYFDFLSKNASFVRLLLWENLEFARNIEGGSNVLFNGIEKLLEKGKDKGFVRMDIDIKQTVMSCNLLCFSTFSNINTLSKIMGEDLTSEKELTLRKNHIADVLTEYILKK